MTTFAILAGKSLKSAIAGYGKIAATFTERTHQLAYSALNHVEQHHDAVYCNAIYAATPKNYRTAVVKWFTAFGKVAFDAKKIEFTYSKGKKSDLPAALTISPADYEKQGKTSTASAPKSLYERYCAQIKALMDADDFASKEDERFVTFMETQLANYAKIMKREPLVAAVSNVVEMPKADAAKEEAPKARKPKVAAKQAEGEAVAA